MRMESHPARRHPGLLSDNPKRRLYLETQILYDLLPTAQWVHLAAALVVFGLLLRHVETGQLLRWLGFVLLVLTLRVVVAQRYERVPKPPENPQLWFNWFLAGTVLYGVLWSGTAILLIPVEQPPAAGFTALLLCALAAGAVAVSAVNLEVFVTYAASTMWPYAALLISSRQDPQALYGWLVLLFFVVISIMAFRVHSFFRRLIDLQLKNRMLEQEVRRESRKRQLAENALLDHTLEEELADLIRKKSAVLREPAGEIQEAPNGTAAVESMRRYLVRLNDLLLHQLESAEDFLLLTRDSNLSHDQRKNLTVVEKILHDAAAVLRRLHPEKGVIETPGGTEKERINLRRDLVYLTHELPLAHKAKFITLRRRIDKDVPQFVYGDEGKLQEILQQLVRNACENSDGGTITICVSKEVEDERTIRLEFRVEDTGVGIPAEVREALVDPGRVVLEPGTGLAVVRGLVDALGGEVFAKSVIGAGSVIGFRLTFEKEGTQAFCA